MSNSVVALFRQVNPETTLGDEEITELMYEATRGDPIFDQDAEFLSQARSLLPKPSWQEYVRQIIGEPIRTGADVIAGIPEAVGIAAQRLGRATANVPPETPVEEMPADVSGMAEAIRQAGARIAPERVPELAESFGATKVPGALGSAVGFMAGGVAGRLVRVPQWLGIAGLGAATEAAAGYKEAKAMGASDEDAWRTYVLRIPGGASEAVPLAGILGRLNKLSQGTLARYLVQPGKEAVEEALQEALQGAAGDVIAKRIVAYDPDRKEFAGLMEQAAAGGIVGGVLGLVASALGGKVREDREGGTQGRRDAETPRGGETVATTPGVAAIVPGAPSAVPAGAVAPAVTVAPAEAALPSDLPAEVQAYLSGLPEDQLTQVTRMAGLANMGQMTPEMEAAIMAWPPDLKAAFAVLIGQPVGQASTSAVAPVVARSFQERFPIGATVDYVPPGSISGTTREAGQIVGYRQDPTTGDAFAEIELPSGRREFAGDVNDIRLSSATAGAAPAVTAPVAPTTGPATAVAATPTVVEPAVPVPAVVAEPPPTLMPVPVPVVAPAPAPVAVPGAAERLLDLTDYENEAVRSKEGDEAGVIKPAYEEITDAPAFSEELGTRLTEDARAGDTKSETRRLTWIEDQETGEVIGLPTYQTQREGKTEVRVGVAPGRETGTTLEKLLGVEMEGGGARYAVLGTTRLKTGVSGTNAESTVVFEDARVFEREYVRPYQERMAKEASYRSAMTGAMQRKGFGEEGEEVEFEGEAQEADDTEKAVTFWSALIEKLAGIGVAEPQQLTRAQIEEAILEVSDEGAKDLDLKQALLHAMQRQYEILRKDARFEALGKQVGGQVKQQDKLREYLAIVIHEKLQGFDSFAGLEAELRQAVLLTEPGAASASGLGPAQQEGAGRLLFFSTPEETDRPRSNFAVASNPEVRRRLQELAQILQEAGLNLRIYQALKAELGAYNPSDRTITLGLYDVLNPSGDNLRLLLHEAGHDFLRTLPAEVQVRVRAAMDAFSDEALGLERSTDPRIRAANPAGLSASVLAEERLVEHLALQGVEREQARGIAAAIFRFLRDLYLRAAMWLQERLARPANPAVVKAYVENRFAQFVAGDERALGLFEFLRPPAANSVRVRMHRPAQPIGVLWERMDEATGTILHPFLIPESEGAIELNLERTQRAEATAGPVMRRVFMAQNAVITAPGEALPGTLSITAYHGTPHEVDRFSTAKIRTGEGAQVYGWGLYYAGNRKVAEEYQRSLSGTPSSGPTDFLVDGRRIESTGINQSPEFEAAKLVYTLGYSEALKSAEVAYEQSQTLYDAQVADAVSKLEGKQVEAVLKGNLYTVSLEVEEDELLDWDAPLSEQSEKVKRALEQSGLLNERSNLQEIAPDNKASANQLRNIGIKGIRYLDQGSRPQWEIKPTSDGRFAVYNVGGGRPGFTGQTREAAQKWIDERPKTYNYVIFDEKDIRITARNGQPVPTEEVLYSTPVTQRAGAAAGAPTGEALQAEIRGNTQLAVLNELVEIDQAVLQALLASPLAQAQLARGQNEAEEGYRARIAGWFHKTFRIADPAALKGHALQVAQDRGLQQNAGQRIGDETNQVDAAAAAYRQVFGMQVKIGRAVATFRERATAAEKEHEQGVERLEKRAKDFADIEGLRKEWTEAIQIFMRRVQKDIVQESRGLGVVMQQIAEIERNQDRNFLTREYGPVFRRLFTGNQLYGEQLFRYLDQLANDPTIDFNAGINEIRAAMRENVEAGVEVYGPLLENTREARALLSTVVAYAKTHEALMALSEARRLRKGEERMAIVQELRGLLRDADELRKAVRLLGRNAAIEERAKNAFRKEVNYVRAKQRARARAQAQAEAGELAIRVLDQARERLKGQAGVRAVYNFGEGMAYDVPERLPNGETHWTRKQIKLSAKGGQITNPAELSRDLEGMRRWMMEREETGVIDGRYREVEAQFNEIWVNGVFSPDVVKTSALLSELYVSDAGRQAAAFGLPAGRQAQQMIQRYGGMEKTLKPRMEELVAKVERERHAAARLLKEDGSVWYYLAQYYSPAIEFRDSWRRVPGWTDEQNQRRSYEELLRHFLRDPVKRQELAGKEEGFMTALRRHIEAEEAANAFFEKHNINRVRGDVEVMGPEGEPVAGERFRSQPGFPRFPRGISTDFRVVLERLNAAGWMGAAADFDGAVTFYLAQNGEAAREVLARYFGHAEIERLFTRALAMKEHVPVFPAPVLADGITRPDADPALTHEAYEESGGDVIAFAERMYELHHGTGSKAEYLREVLQRFQSIYAEMAATMEEIEPAETYTHKTIKGMIPAFMIEARKIEHWPGIWTQAMSFDQHAAPRVLSHVAGQVAFGPNAERLELAFRTLKGEVGAEVDKLKAAEHLVRDRLNTRSTKVQNRALAEALGGPGEVKRLRRVQEMQKLLETFESGLIAYFRSNHSPVKPVRAGQEIASTFAGLLIQQPGSAIAQLYDVFAPLLVGGVSPLTVRQVIRSGKTGLSEVVGSLAQGIGLTLKGKDRWNRKYLELGLGDPAGAARVRDAMLDEPKPGESGAARLIRTLRRGRAVQNAALNFAREGTATATTFRPLAPFTSTAYLINKANTVSTWEAFEDFTSAALLGMRRNPERFTDAGFYLKPEEWASLIGYKGLSKESFVKLTSNLIEKHGIDFNRMVREAMVNQSEGKPLLSKRTLMQISEMVLNDVALEGSIANMSLGAYNQSAMRFMLPLLGWPIRRALQIARLGEDAQGVVQMTALRQALMSMTAMIAGGLAFGMLLDWYNEELLGKRRNLRKPLEATSGKDFLLSLLEQTTRVGTFGMWGEGLNFAVNVGTGEGDNRGLSIDQRVVFVSSAQGLIRAMTTWINQDFNGSYATVYRQVLQGMGGNGALQYLELVNNAFGPEWAGPIPVVGAWAEAEARVVRRIDASNWLRVTGRQRELEVRPSRGGYNTPTPLTPFITEMALAAYSDDGAAFDAAYQAAIEEAKGAGKEDPEEYVKTAFRARHPLVSVFRVAPSAGEYQALLAGLPENGRESVGGAVEAFNRYLTRIGGKGFEGRKAKEKKERAGALGFSLRTPAEIRAGALEGMFRMPGMGVMR